ncbi:hypothetical protein TRVL_00020 [Trypanosoma vivax]|nr:hypothetical protein TRVL_00020 [Trypanosoma vivax]
MLKDEIRLRLFHPHNVFLLPRGTTIWRHQRTYLYICRAASCSLVPSVGCSARNICRAAPGKVGRDLIHPQLFLKSATSSSQCPSATHLSSFFALAFILLSTFCHRPRTHLGRCLFISALQASCSKEGSFPLSSWVRMADKVQKTVKRSTTLFLNDTEQFLFDFGAASHGVGDGDNSVCSQSSDSCESADLQGEGGDEGRTAVHSGNTTAEKRIGGVKQSAVAVPIDASAAREFANKALGYGHRFLLSDVSLDDAVVQFQAKLRRYAEELSAYTRHKKARNEAGKRYEGRSSHPPRSSRTSRGGPRPVAANARDGATEHDQ